MFKRPKHIHQNKTPKDWIRQFERARSKMKEKCKRMIGADEKKESVL